MTAILIFSYIAKLLLCGFVAHIFGQVVFIAGEYRNKKTGSHISYLGSGTALLLGLVIFNNIYYMFDALDIRMWAALVACFLISRGLVKIREVRDHNLAEKVALLKYVEVFENSPDVYLVCDDGFIIDVNSTYCNQFGWRRSEVVGKAWIHYLHPEDISNVSEAVKSLDESSARNESIRRYLCKDGTYKTVDWNTRKVNDVIYATGRILK